MSISRINIFTSDTLHELTEIINGDIKGNETIKSTNLIEVNKEYIMTVVFETVDTQNGFIKHAMDCSCSACIIELQRALIGVTGMGPSSISFDEDPMVMGRSK